MRTVDWFRYIDGYCERVAPGFWDEPLNAVTNAAFLLAAGAAAAYVRRREEVRGDPVLLILTLLVAVIGIGSFLFHTFATAWAAAADTVPILAFTLVYICLANRDFWGWPWWLAGLGALAYIPYSRTVTPLFEALPFFDVSGFYWPLPLLIFVYAGLLRGRLPEVARNLAIGAGILCVSLTARSLDETLCASLPLGTHFLWHILNAIMLAWMIETWLRHKRQRRV